MRHVSVPRFVPPLAVVGLVGAGLIYLVSVSGAANGPLQASGTIESVEVGVASEVSGRVSDVLVDEGQTVAAGDPLLRLDARLLEAQRRSAQAAGEAAVAAAQLAKIEAQQALDDLYDNAPVAAAQAELSLANARDALHDADYTWTVQQQGNRASDDTIKGARARLLLAQEEMDRAKRVLDRTHGDAGEDANKAQALAQYIQAKAARDAAQRALNWYTGKPSDIDQGILDAEVALAKAQVADAERRLSDLQPGPDPDALALAQASLALASAQLAAAQAKAEVDLQTFDLQLEKLLIRAPLGGVVTARHIEPGEVLAAGAEALSIGQLDRLTITVYLAEDRYGQVSLGDEAVVTVDAFPGVTFHASVVRIADKAEYTPRNVQTDEGRRTTVFAVELSVDDPSGRLKPGMPADVVFEVR
ncbi:MAG TPA: HlyD family efflux transporter periplasmic adaptor subunit [Anaerolineales bacterium]|nr:HlyD family efflux transporter periplasmic adaptor subunit [Anaerolineales bacterium]